MLAGLVSSRPERAKRIDGVRRNDKSFAYGCLASIGFFLTLRLTG